MATDFSFFLVEHVVFHDKATAVNGTEGYIAVGVPAVVAWAITCRKR